MTTQYPSTTGTSPTLTTPIKQTAMNILRRCHKICPETEWTGMSQYIVIVILVDLFRSLAHGN